MFVLITYDVSTTDKKGAKRLRRVAKACQNFGQRVQYFVFECILEPGQWELLKQKLIDEIDLESDSLRFYYLGKNWRRRVEHIGFQRGFDQEGPLII